MNILLKICWKTRLVISLSETHQLGYIIQKITTTTRGRESVHGEHYYIKNKTTTSYVPNIRHFGISN
jgi:hypothetical protein